MATIILSVIFCGQNRLNWSFRRRYWGQPTSSPEWSKGKSRELWKRMWLLCCRCYSLAVDKGGEIRDTKTFNLLLNIVSLQVLVDVSRVSPCVINLSRNKNICCGLKKVVAQSRARVYFEQQILASLLVFHQTHNLSRNKFARVLANQQISAPHFFNLQQMFLSRVKLITQGEKRETSTKTCNLS